jgi:class 3 adenylate cyclase
MVEVTFTVSPRIRQVAAHTPELMPTFEYFRQLYFSSELDLPEDFEAVWDVIVLESLELSAGEKAIISLTLPAKFIIVFDPITHSAQFVDVKGEPTKERQAMSLIFEAGHSQHATLELRPGPLRLTVENRTDKRLLPTVFVADHDLHDLMSKRRPFLTAKRLLSNQTFRDLYRTDTLDVDQRLKITSLTFLFTDLRGPTELYERVGDLVAFDLVRTHFDVLNEIVAAQGGAVVKTIGDAVMATFPTPDRAMAAALKMRDAMHTLNEGREKEDLILKIGMHVGPCIAVTLNERQDYFGQTVNIASRVQGLATAREIFATNAVVEDALTSGVLSAGGLTPMSHNATLKGIANEVAVYAIP